MSPENRKENEEKENEKRWLILRAKVVEENIKSAFRLFRENGVEPVLIKGWAAAVEYPQKYQRSFSDIDLCVSPESFERSLAIISGEEGGRLNIDLHRGLRHLDTVEWERLFCNSGVVMLDEVPVRVLRREDHLRILCVHWLTDGGAYKVRLLDIYYLLKNNADTFDWEYCFEEVGSNRRDWIIKTIAVVRRYHKLDVSKLPFAAEPDRLPGWFVKTLEREWASDSKLKDIQAVLGNKRELWTQVKKRLRPNPIQATVFMEGSFDSSSRVFYQAGSFYKRLKPSIRNIVYRLKNGFQKKFY